MRPYITDRSRLITPGITVVRGGEAITIGGSGGRPTASGKTNPSPGRGDPGGRPPASGKTTPSPVVGVRGAVPPQVAKPTPARSWGSGGPSPRKWQNQPQPGRGGPGGRPPASGKTNPSPGRGGPGGRPPSSGKTNPGPGRGGPGGRPPQVAKPTPARSWGSGGSSPRKWQNQPQPRSWGSGGSAPRDSTTGYGEADRRSASMVDRRDTPAWPIWRRGCAETMADGMIMRRSKAWFTPCTRRRSRVSRSHGRSAWYLPREPGSSAWEHHGCMTRCTSVTGLTP